MASTSDILAASGEFYAALNDMARGDAAAMAGVWARRGRATAQHPIGGRDVGHDKVVASFARVADIAGGGEIRLEDQIIETGSDMAVETGTEIGSLIIAGHEVTIRHRVTNVYRREDGSWKLTHHHTDISPRLLEILDRLNQAAGSTDEVAPPP